MIVLSWYTDQYHTCLTQSRNQILLCIEVHCFALVHTQIQYQQKKVREKDKTCSLAVRAPQPAVHYLYIIIPSPALTYEIIFCMQYVGADFTKNAH